MATVAPTTEPADHGALASAHRRKGNIRNEDPSMNSRRAGVFVLRPWNCMWVRNVMNEFLKIGPVSIGLLVDTQQLQSGITGACSFSLGVRI